MTNDEMLKATSGRDTDDAVAVSSSTGLVMRLRQHALPGPHDEREVLHSPLLSEAADMIECLNKEILYLDAKIESATVCHPLAVQALLYEAKHRTHFDV